MIDSETKQLIHDIRRKIAINNIVTLGALMLLTGIFFLLNITGEDG